MARFKLKQVIVEVHRRSLWQVAGIYLGLSWAVIEAVDHVVERYLLPEWVSAAAIILLLLGLPVVLATAFVREEGGPVRAEPRDPTLLTGPEPASGGPDTGVVSMSLTRHLTWPKAIMGGALAFGVLGLASALIVIRGEARVTEARGAAGDAFAERAWVLIADFEAPSDEKELALAAQTALTVDLQQSQYVNVFGRHQITPVLRRMGLADTVAFDERLALEVAERQGLAAVLAASIGRLGSDYIFTARVIQPGSARELIAVRAAARADRLLDGVEALSREVRLRLGETQAHILRSKPLPQVTTPSLDALKKYAQAEEALLSRYDESQAVELAREAIRLDSTFSMAYRLVSVLHYNRGQMGAARRLSRRAYEFRDRLTDRERLHVEAFYHMTVGFDPRAAAETYERLLEQYPDDSRALNNLGVMAQVWLGDERRGYELFRRAFDLAPAGAFAFDNMIGVAVWVGRWEAVDSFVARAESRGFEHEALRGRIGLAFARGELKRIDAICDALLAEPDGRDRMAAARTFCGTYDMARGRLRQGVQRLGEAARTYSETGRRIPLAETVSALALAEAARRRPEAAEAQVARFLTRFPADSIPEPDRSVARTYLRLAGWLMDRPDLVRRVEAAYPAYPDSTHWFAAYSDGLVTAARALAAGDGAAARAAMREVAGSRYRPAAFRPLDDLLLAYAFDAKGTSDSAIAHLEAAIRPGQLAIYHMGALGRYHAPAAYRRLAELYEETGRRADAARAYQRFLGLWSDTDPELQPAVDAARRKLAALAAAETG